MADRARDPESLEREIERTRDELARTIDALAERVSPRNVASRGVARLKEEAAQVTAAVGTIVGPVDREDPRAIARRNKAIMVGAGVALAATVLVLWGRRRR
ncbi:MAG: hypothetical protein JWN00_2049 [Actinomycetia bacterium]|jgi:Protein of unknown function (DUF3618)|nr:hypothetical protein [Actinomycetes bacterium]